MDRTLHDYLSICRLYVIVENLIKIKILPINAGRLSETIQVLLGIVEVLYS